MKKTVVALFLVTFFNCKNERSKEKHYTTRKICDKMYVETFTVFETDAVTIDFIKSYSVKELIKAGKFD